VAYAVVLWLCASSVRPSVTSQYCIQTTLPIELVLVMHAFFHLSYSKKIQVFSVIRVLRSGAKFQTLDLENFLMASRLYCQQSLSVVEFVQQTYDGCHTVAEQYRWSTVTAHIHRSQKQHVKHSPITSPKCQPIFTILLRTDSVVNLKQKHI